MPLNDVPLNDVPLNDVPLNDEGPLAGAFVVGLTRIELVTSSLSGMRSNRLSYSPSSGEKG